MTWYEIYDDSWVNLDHIQALDIFMNHIDDFGIRAFYKDKIEMLITGRTEREIQNILKDMMAHANGGNS